MVLKMDQNIPRPREATSVAIKIGAFPLRNSGNKMCNTLRTGKPNSKPSLIKYEA